MQPFTFVDTSKVQEILKEGSKRIAPLWSLESFVAVNPYMGLSEKSFESAMDFLTKTSDAKPALPLDFYLQALRKGRLTVQDIDRALQETTWWRDKNVTVFMQRVFDADKDAEFERIQTLSDVASQQNGKKWRRFMVDRISFWASAYFDKHQALWKTSNSTDSIYTAWKKEAEVDFGAEVMGLKGFRKLVRELPENHLEAAAVILEALNVHEDLQPYYLHALLMKLNGWAGIAARIDWDAQLAGSKSYKLQEFLTILLVWEYAFSRLLPYAGLDAAWIEAQLQAKTLLDSDTFSESLSIHLILQKSFDIATQRTIIDKLNKRSTESAVRKDPQVQAVFCIDVRSETFRRHLESVDEQIDTLGFAGFFGFPIHFVPLGHKEGADQCPVLLAPSYEVKESLPDSNEEVRAIRKRKLIGQIGRVWKGFRSGAVSCFGFVSPLGLYFLPKLISDQLGITKPVSKAKSLGLNARQVNKTQVSLTSDNGVSGIPLADQIQLAKSALTAMSLTENFAPLVLITGHGASTVNNPHATGLDCGACGGNSGEANAKVAAQILNEPEVRGALKGENIQIPEETLFVAGLHDTTTDQVSLFIPHTELSADQQLLIDELAESLRLAGERSRMERGARMQLSGKQVDKQVINRSRDWSQVRPEWGLAGCSSFIVAPRERTAGLNFGGKAFMHSYDWKADKHFKVLETIMTAPMVVTSWINLQYFASTIDNKRFGAGNKALHNVVGGLGVLEGFGGDLRTGLPWQSVHDGSKFQHEPHRLNVIIEAPVDEMSRILNTHQHIRELCDNQWIYLYAMNGEGKVAYKYIGSLEWEVIAD